MPSTGTPEKRLVLIHGHGNKPQADALRSLWLEALRRGVRRDFGKLEGALDGVSLSFVHYGDLLRPLLEARGSRYDEALDLADLRTALTELSRRDKSRQFRRMHYERLRGRSASRKWFMVLSAPFARLLGMDRGLVARVSPELSAYQQDTAFATAARARLSAVLQPALDAGEDVLLVAHCLGSVIAYDTLWAMTHDDARPLNRRRLSTFVTLGSPLANDTVRARLLGTNEAPDRRYPDLLRSWYNLAAADDYVCHDTTVANDFSPMLRQRLISRLEDFAIYNLTQRYGRSNPHSVLGYLIHPRMALLLADWLQD